MNDDVKTLDGWGRVIRRARSEELPFKDALSPPMSPIVDGMKLAVHYSPPIRDWQISPPRNTLVDLSSFNAQVLSRQPGYYPMGPVPRTGGAAFLDSGDYITNQLCVKSVLTGHLVRIFVQDDPSLPGGITFDHCNVGDGESRRPADFQIWYNGAGTVRLKGTSRICCTIYAPHANLEIGPGVLFEGAIVCKNVHLTGGLIFFDKDLGKISDWRHMSRPTTQPPVGYVHRVHNGVLEILHDLSQNH